MSNKWSKSQLGDLRQMDRYKSEHMKFLSGSQISEIQTTCIGAFESIF